MLFAKKSIQCARTILRLQPRDKAAKLGVKTREFFLEEIRENRVWFLEERNAFVLDHQ